MAFVQIIDYETTQADDVNVLFDEWLTATQGKRTASHELHTRDRQNPAHFVDIVEFPSYEQAMKNNELPATQQIAERMRALCTGEPRFMNLDVLRDETL